MVILLTSKWLKGERIALRFPEEASNLSAVQTVHTGPGALSATRADMSPFSRVKQAGRVAAHSPLINSKVKNGLGYISNPCIYTVMFCVFFNGHFHYMSKITN
jgi:hypothetical protein